MIAVRPVSLAPQKQEKKKVLVRKEQIQQYGVYVDNAKQRKEKQTACVQNNFLQNINVKAVHFLLFEIFHQEAYKKTYLHLLVQNYYYNLQLNSVPQLYFSAYIYIITITLFMCYSNLGQLNTKLIFEFTIFYGTTVTSLIGHSCKTNLNN